MKPRKTVAAPLKIAAACMIAAAVSSSIQAFAAEEPAETITIESLLEEMADRETLASFPDPFYTCKQFSSYDRASVSSEDRESWFANNDRGQYLRVEENDDRKEYVMMDAQGPGAVVRIWSANPKGTLRVYLDDNDSPVIEAPFEDVLDGKWKVPSPMAAARSKGHNLYLPIPYQKRCKITSDEGEFYYQINYRTYEKGTSIKTLTAIALDNASQAITEAGDALHMKTKSVPPGKEMPKYQRVVIKPGEENRIDLPEGPGLIRLITVYVVGHISKENMRPLVLKGEFDGIQTIWCPLGDFAGTGAGAEEYFGFYRFSGRRKPYVFMWPMPYKESAAFSVVNHGDEPLDVVLSILYADWTWNENSMHFYARWHCEHPIPTRPMKDWNYIDIKGKGVFVGDTLAVINPVNNWWGEGDEKIYVDNEPFPSHFGTGTEDYYGYAWCCNELFQAPFHAQPRCDGLDYGNNWGHTTVLRDRALDAIPFEKSFRFDMEVWHWAECDVGYAATTFFYAMPGATHNREPQPEAAKAPLPELTPPSELYKVKDAIECEDIGFETLDWELGVMMMEQQTAPFGKQIASGMRQLLVRVRAAGETLDLIMPAANDGPCKVVLYATRSHDFCKIRLRVNGVDTGKEIELFIPEKETLIPTGPIELGTFEPKDGQIIITVEAVERNKAAGDRRHEFGLDCVVLTPEL